MSARYFQASPPESNLILQFDDQEDAGDLARALAKELEAVTSVQTPECDEGNVAKTSAIPIQQIDLPSFNVPVIRKRLSKRQMRKLSHSARSRSGQLA